MKKLVLSDPAASLFATSALAGSLWLIGLTPLISLPIGVGAAIYLEEYAAASRWRTLPRGSTAKRSANPWECSQGSRRTTSR